MTLATEPVATCHARLDGDELIVGNALIERRWRVADGRLTAIALVDGVSGRSWVLPSATAGTVPPTAPAASRPPRLSVTRSQAGPLEPASLTAELTCGSGPEAVTWRFQVFPDHPSVTCRLLAWPGGPEAAAGAAEPGAAITGVETDGAVAADRADADLCERLVLACHHAHLHTVALHDRTDGHDNLAAPVELRLSACERLALSGCVFAVEDPLTGDGLLLLKHAPLPHARPVPCAVDLATWHEGSVQPGRPAVALRGHGAAPGYAGYAWSVACYRGGADGRIATLHRLQRCFRTYDAGRDGRLVSNTWGDRNRDGRICAAFMAAEIAAGGQLGIDVVQIDDGWQRGTTANSVNRANGGVWEGFWAADDHFWDPHPSRFPEGLASTSAAARAAGLAFGLWFAPDSAQDFRNWRRDADTVLGFWRDHGVTRVKIDGVKAHSALGEANLQRFFALVLETSAGAVTFDLDVTAEIRPGYYGAMAVGPLFVENRYSDWHRWWPHATLRNLWQLAHWLDPVRLRMEFLNRQRNQGLYAGDPLAPGVYPADWLFASIMVSSPLAWFEVSELPEDDAARLRPVIALWKAHRAELHGGTILPVGDCPSGAATSGFCSLAADGRSAYLVALREPCAAPTARWRLPLAGDWSCAVLGGAGRAAVRDGHAELAWDAAPGWMLVRLTAMA